MATERHRPERRAARITPGSAGTAARRLFLFGMLVFLGWCGLALLSGATASAAEQPGSAPAHGSSSLLGTRTVADVLDQATSAVRSAGNRPLDLVTGRQSDQRSARDRGAEAAGAARSRDGATTRTGADPAGRQNGGTARSMLDLVSVPVRVLADPGARLPVDIAVSAVDRTLGHVTGASLRPVTGDLVAPLDATVTRAATGLAAVRALVPTRHDATASPDAGRAGVRLGTQARSAAPGSDAFAPAGPAHGTAVATELRAGQPTGGHHTPSAPAAGDAPAMPFGVAGGSASGSGSGNAGASGTYLDFAGVRPSAASGPVWTVRQNDEQAPLDNPDRPRVSPD